MAYDVRQKQWFDTAASNVRHFPGRRSSEILHWTDSEYTFNTSCYSCHVSQLSTNYNIETDSYHTSWSEAGINCENCHGPAAEHNRVCREAPGKVPADLKIASWKQFSVEQKNAACSPCHAKMVPLTTSFKPGDRFFDHYDLSTLEHSDYYPDGRDLGENFSYTSWRLSPCVKSGQLDCLHCHTSSGRYRFEDGQENQACLPCHQANVDNVTDHTHHPEDHPASRCVSCHMPTTEFARIQRSDHSMRPPMPAATLAFKSPNACNLCHQDRDAIWADQVVRLWRKRDYQATVLHWAQLIDAARKRDWTRLEEIFAYLKIKDHDEIVATSLVRLLRACEDESKWPVLVDVLSQDPSPLVRSCAAEALGYRLTPDTVKTLLAAISDEYRLVRIRAASALASYPPHLLSEENSRHFQSASEEYVAAMMARPDDHASQYNLGNYYMNCKEFERAVASFEISIKLCPNNIPPRVNAALAYNALGQNQKAEASLRSALRLEPDNFAANFNLGLLLAEVGRRTEAEATIQSAFAKDPQSAEAAYNLGIIRAQDRIEEGLEWYRRAHQLQPDNTKYAHTLAYYLHQHGDAGEAIHILQQIIKQQPAHTGVYLLLAQIFEEQGNSAKAQETYQQAATNKNISRADRRRFAMKIQTLDGG